MTLLLSRSFFYLSMSFLVHGLVTEVSSIQQVSRNNSQIVNNSLADGLKSKRSKRSTSVQTIVAGIRNGQIESAVEQFNQLNDDSYIGWIIKSAYDVEHLDKLLKFSRRLPKIPQSVIAYEAINNEIYRYKDWHSHRYIMLAYKVKEAMEMPNYKNIQQEYKNRILNLQKSMSKGVQAIIWAPKVCIKSVYRNEYLFASNKLYDDDRRRVFLWTPGNQVSNGEWILEPAEDGEYFYIKNTYYNEYLYTPFFKLDAFDRFVFTWIPGGIVTRGRWRIEPDASGDRFYLKNVEFGEYLESNNYTWDSDRWKATTSFLKKQTPTGLWRITSC